MATDTATTQSYSIVNIACGSSTGAGAAIDVTLGFKPRHVRVFNETDATMWEKFAEQADANTAKTVTAGDLTKDTGSAIVLMGDQGDSYAGFEMSATLAASGKALHWIAFG
jgi:hypothetical protein